MKTIAVIGTGGHAKVALDIIKSMGDFNIVGAYDDYKQQGESVLSDGICCIGKINDIIKYSEIDLYFIAVGDNFGRFNIYERLKNKGIKFATLIHPSAVIASGVEIGEGSVVMAGVVINSGTKIKEHAIINTSSSIDHDNYIGNFASVSPGVITGGNVTIDDYAAVCMGAKIRNGINVFEYSVVGMGAVVLEDVFPNVLAYGNPCKKIRHRKFGESYLHQKL